MRELSQEIKHADAKYASELKMKLKRMGISKEDYKKYIYWKHCEETMNDVEFTEEEKAFRRGFSHGFYAARKNPNLLEKEVDNWVYGNEPTCPPGTGMAGVILNGLIKSINGIDPAFSQFSPD